MMILERYQLLCDCLRDAATPEEASSACSRIMALERLPLVEGEGAADVRLQAFDLRLAETALMSSWMERDAAGLAAANQRRF